MSFTLFYDVIDDNSYVVKGNTNSMNFDEHDEYIFQEIVTMVENYFVDESIKELTMIEDDVARIDDDKCHHVKEVGIPLVIDKKAEPIPTPTPQFPSVELKGKKKQV